jgi:amidase
MQAIDFVKAKRAWRQFGMAMDRMLADCDLILTPTLGEPPVRIGSQAPGKSDERSMKLLASCAGSILVGSRRLADNPVFAEIVRKNMRGQMPFTFIANMTGHPAMSVPMHWTEDNLPCGVQFIGRFGEDATLLKLACQLEKAHPWVCRMPSMLAAAHL